MSASEKLLFFLQPCCAILLENSKGNTDLTVYRYNEENEKYETVPYTFSENGEGVLVDIVKNGIYILCDRPAEFAVEERGEKKMRKHFRQKNLFLKTRKFLNRKKMLPRKQKAFLIEI